MYTMRGKLALLISAAYVSQRRRRRPLRRHNRRAQAVLLLLAGCHTQQYVGFTDTCNYEHLI
jgi:hypothetical protein